MVTVRTGPLEGKPCLKQCIRPSLQRAPVSRRRVVALAVPSIEDRQAPEQREEHNSSNAYVDANRTAEAVRSFDDAAQSRGPSLQSAADLVGDLWRTYCRKIETDPIKAKAVTSFLGFMIGDSIAQKIEGHTFNPVRSLRLGSYGLTIDGPIGHAWYKFLDKHVYPDNPQCTAAVLIKTAADQIAWAPIMTCVYFAFLRTLEGHPELIVSTIQSKVVATVVANYCLWPAAHFINFRYVPAEHRVLYNNVVSVFWNAFLSTLSHAPTIEPTNMMDFFNQQVDHLPAPLHERAAEFAESLYRGSRPLHEQAALFGENMRLPENLRPMLEELQKVKIPTSIKVTPIRGGILDNWD